MGIYTEPRRCAASLYRIYTYTLSHSKPRLSNSQLCNLQCSTSSSPSRQGFCTSEICSKDLPTGSLRSEALTPSPPVLFPPFLLLHLSHSWTLLFPLWSFWKRSSCLCLLLPSNASLQPLPRSFLAISRLLFQYRPASFPSFCLFSSCLQPSLDLSSFSLQSSIFFPRLPRFSLPFPMHQELLPNHSNPCHFPISYSLLCLLGFPRPNCLFPSFLCYFCGPDRCALMSFPIL
jgi:hypothetical protein